MWAVRLSEAVTRSVFFPVMLPAGEDSSTGLLIRHGRITLTALLEGLHSLSLPSACIFKHYLLRALNLDAPSESPGVNNPSPLLVNGQQKYNLLVFLKLCKGILKTI